MSLWQHLSNLLTSALLFPQHVRNSCSHFRHPHPASLGLDLLARRSRHDPRRSCTRSSPSFVRCLIRNGKPAYRSPPSKVLRGARSESRETLLDRSALVRPLSVRSIAETRRLTCTYSPILWFIGASYLWRSQDPLLAARAKDPEAQVAFRFRLRRQRAGLATEPILDEPAEEMKVLWRLEERTWAKRCARALGVVFLIGGMVILVAVYTHVR